MTRNTNTLTKIALMAALLCIISPFAVVFPFSPVPISLATLMLYLSVYILNKKHAVISCGIYLLIGLVGIPVFSGFTGGIGKVLGPTGGYLIGYITLVFISGWFIEKWNGSIMQGVGMAVGTAVCYLIGSLWLSYQAGIEFSVALSIGTLPFIPGDIVKIIAGVIIGTAMRKRLVKVGMM